MAYSNRERKLAFNVILRWRVLYAETEAMTRVISVLVENAIVGIRLKVVRSILCLVVGQKIVFSVKNGEA